MALMARGSGKVEPLAIVLDPPGAGQVLVRVLACGVCRTDLHVVDGELPLPALPLIPGHEIVGVVEQLGPNVTTLVRGDRVGIPWLAWSCGECEYCRNGRENLCPRARFTGYHVHGGYAEQVSADARFCLRLPDAYDDTRAAPLLCAGLIGYRAYRMAGAGRRIGVYGFGAAAHIITQVAVDDGREVYAFAAPGDDQALGLARDVGAVWAGPSNAPPPAPLDCALIFAPAGHLVPEALSRTKPGGTVVCAGIHMSDIPSFPYQMLWGERTVRSVANLTREDGQQFLKVAAKVPLRLHITVHRLADANRALGDLRVGAVSGAAVLVP
jgi:propanol-preferring alcohol dehydrogenase